jgi:hypothetical protein
MRPYRAHLGNTQPRQAPPLDGALTRLTCHRVRCQLPLPGPPFRLPTSTELLRRLVNCQRLVHSLATNLHGPTQPLTSVGRPAACGDPIPNTTGNIPAPSPRCPTPEHLGSLCRPTRPRYRTRKC